MPSNIEIKARVADPAHTRTLAERLAQAPPVVLHQQDTFFPCANGRLKLRQLSEAHGELIAYQRADVSGTKQSDYLIYPTTSPAVLRATLASALGLGVVVTKTRRLFLVGQTRIHLDEVENLGSFLELEVVLADGQDPAEGHGIAREIMAALEVSDADLLDCAYADLLARQGGV